MKPLMMAALVVQLTSTGGAGSGRTGTGGESGASAKDVGKHFSALKNEVTSLSQQFREARERARLDNERKKREAEGFYEPPPAAAAGASTATGASPTR
jgi:hypothetical protein